MKDSAYEIAINPTYNGYKRGLESMMYKLFDKKIESRKKANVNEVLAQELHKPVIKKFKTTKMYEKFKDNIWVTDFAEIALSSSKNRSVKYFFFVIDVSTKHTWIKPLKDKKAYILHGFLEIKNESKIKPNKLW